MRTVSLVLDIQTQSLDSLYTYVVPADMVGVEVGCAVLVEFGARRAILDTAARRFAGFRN